MNIAIGIVVGVTCCLLYIIGYGLDSAILGLCFGSWLCVRTYAD